MVFYSPVFWLGLFLIPIATLLPDVVLQMYGLHSINFF